MVVAHLTFDATKGILSVYAVNGYHPIYAFHMVSNSKSVCVGGILVTIQYTIF